jgi:hypothetical protein
MTSRIGFPGGNKPSPFKCGAHPAIVHSDRGEDVNATAIVERRRNQEVGIAFPWNEGRT